MSILTYFFLFLSLFLAAICHELAHGYTAFLLGDDTAKKAGRLTFNPLKHIDPIGTIIFPILLRLAGFIPLILFKPVPINPLNFENPVKDSMKVAIAGPGINFFLALITVLIVRLLILIPGMLHSIIFLIFLKLFAEIFIMINLILASFNLIPLPPLDGHWVLSGILPVRVRFYFEKFKTYFTILLFILVLSGKINFLFNYILRFFSAIISFLLYS